MAKIHLRVNKADSPNGPKAACASRPGSSGKVKFNHRTTYRFMASAIVGKNEFCATDREARCAHCVDAINTWLNKARVANCMEPIIL